MKAGAELKARVGFANQLKIIDFARMLGKTCSNLSLHEDPHYDCGTDNYYEMHIENNIDLKDMRGRWYLTSKNTLRMLIETDYDVIGKTLKFRTPAKCASKNGICRYCYGHLYSQNYAINIGVNSALKLSEKNYQNTMSAKHVLNTSSESIDFNSEFYDYFAITGGFRILFREDIGEYDNLELHINVNAICRDKDVDELEHNEYVHEFIIYNSETEESILIRDKDENAVYLAGDLFTIINKSRKNKGYDEQGWIKIPFSKIVDGKDTFFIRLKNDELTKPLQELKKLIEKGKEVAADSACDLIAKLRYLMKCGGIYSESIHVEVICRNLIRDAENIINLPDWSKKDPEYQITSVHNAILMSSSIINSLTFERHREQLGNPLTYQKTETNFLDRLFILE